MQSNWWSLQEKTVETRKNAALISNAIKNFSILISADFLPRIVNEQKVFQGERISCTEEWLEKCGSKNVVTRRDTAENVLSYFLLKRTKFKLLTAALYTAYCISVTSYKHSIVLRIVLRFLIEIHYGRGIVACLYKVLHSE